MELQLGYGNSMGNTTRFFKKPLCKPKIRDPHKGANMLHLTSLKITEQCDRQTQKTYIPEIDTLQLRAWSLGISELSINVSLHVGYAVIQRFQFPSAMTEPNLSLEGALCTWSAKQHFITRLITPQAILSYLFDLEKRWCFRPCMCY